MKEEKYAIGGMSCAACAGRVEHAAGALNGVSSCRVNLLQNSMTISYDETKVNPSLIAAAVKSAGYSATLASGQAAAPTADKELRAQKYRLIASFIFTLLLMTVSMGPMLGFVLMADAQMAAWTQALLALIVMVLQRQYFIRGFKALGHFAPNMDSLVALGSAASFIYSLYQTLKLSSGMDSMLLHQAYPLYYESAATILCLVGIGKYFEHKAKVKSTQAIASLIDLSPKLIRVRRAGKEQLLSPQDVVIDDIVLVKVGESIGVDGMVTAGGGFVDQSSLTGESLPVKKQVGAKVLSGTMLTQGFIELKAQAVGENTTFAQILKLMDDTVSQKVPIARLADTIAYYFVPAVILLSIITGAVWLNFAPFAQALNFALCVLVVSCPCALGLATPTAVMVGTGRAAKMGILLRKLEVLEVLNRATTVIFDKTGTLTAGQLQLVSTTSARPGLDGFAAMLTFSLESHSAHPLAAALVRSLGAKVKTALPVDDFRTVEGRGIQGVISGQTYYCGHLKWVQEMIPQDDPALPAATELSVSSEAQGLVVLHLFTAHGLLASYVLGDSLKPDAPALIAALHARGLKCLMLTGDRQAAAAFISKKLNLDGFQAALLAADKLQVIKDLQHQGERVVMLGDGVNDALCLTQADVGIGVHGASDIAVSACDLILMNDKLMTLDKALTLSKLTYRNIKENLFWAFIYNVLTIPLAAGLFYPAFGLELSPMLAALLMSLSSICVVSNALRLNFVNLGSNGEAHSTPSATTDEEIKLMTKVISIEGMHCNHCTSSVQQALSALPGASNISVSLEHKCASGDFAATLSDDMLKGVIESLGFKVTAITQG